MGIIDNQAIYMSLKAILPETVLVIFAITVLIYDLFLPDEHKGVNAGICVVGVIAALLSVKMVGTGKIQAFSGMIEMDAFGAFFTIIILLTLLLTLMMSRSYNEWEGIQRGEYYFLLLFSSVGMIVMAKATDLMTVFLGLEILSIPIYVLVGFDRKRMSAIEGALKYFLLGAFATGFLLYGMALIYASTGHTNLYEIKEFIAGGKAATNTMFLAGTALLLVGFGFKVSLVPFHMWTPDAYQGAPTTITAFMSAGPKAAAFAAVIKVLFITLPELYPYIWKGLWVVAVLTMTVGNVTALVQDNVKRMLAYSSIAHAGYVLVGIVSGDNLGAQAAIFYLLIYAFMNIGAFAVAMVISQREDEGYDIGHYRGVGIRYPVLGALMTLFLLSLGGIPPTAGFVGKFYLFSAAVKSGYIWLAVIGVLNSAVSIYYYLRIVVYMYMLKPEVEEIPVRPVGMAISLALVIAAIGVVNFGLFPKLLLDFAEASVLSIIL
ncbi:MAG: NADH-quinone oxidoreductase subunit N [Deltaproteobacteria bacterium]|nr:NADH-quinone oxidoreductase subunit N [Deltaproteobacteria bacterium]